MKNPFKKQNIIDTVVNVGVGGAANVAMDYVFNSVSTLQSLGATTKNAVKIAAGAIGGSLIGGKYARAAFDGIATVGASELISGLVAGSEAPTSGLPFGTIGRAPRVFRRKGIRGVGEPAGAVMSK